MLFGAWPVADQPIAAYSFYHTNFVDGTLPVFGGTFSGSADPTGALSGTFPPLVGAFTLAELDTLIGSFPALEGQFSGLFAPYLEGVFPTFVGSIELDTFIPLSTNDYCSFVATVIAQPTHVLNDEVILYNSLFFASVEFDILIQDTTTLREQLLYTANVSTADAIALTDTNAEQIYRLAIAASTLNAQSDLSAQLEVIVAASDTLLTSDQLDFLARLVTSSTLTATDVATVDMLRLCQMAETVSLASNVSGQAELTARAADDFELETALAYLARLVLADTFTTVSALSADDTARICKLADTIVLASRNVATLETIVNLAEALSLLSSLDTRHALSMADTLAATDAFVAQLLVLLVQAETLALIDEMASSFIFIAQSDDAIELISDQTASLTALFRADDVLAFVGRLPLGDDDYQAWVLNSDSLGVTEYTNWPFNSLATTRRGTFGLTDTGLYELVGDDDDGDPIEALLRTGDLEFSTSDHKRIDRAYLYLTSTDDVYFKTISTHRGQRNEAWYRVDYREGANDGQTRRVRLGKGLRGTTWAFELTNIDGGDFDVRGAEVLPVKLTRKV